MLCKAITPRQTCSKWGFREESSEARRIQLRPESEEATVKGRGIPLTEGEEVRAGRWERARNDLGGP